MDIAQELEQFILTELADPGQGHVGRQDDLLSQGIIDSLGLLKLTTYLEEKYSIAIGPDEIVPENFRNIAALSRFVEHKLPASC
jgi:acyl carrier protein